MIQKLKTQTTITRSDIAELLKSIGAPGEKRDEKIAAIKELEKQNFQGIKLHEALNSYGEF